MTERAANRAEAALSSKSYAGDDVKTVYLDHNLIHYFVQGFPLSANEKAERDALALGLSRYPEIRFAISDWNLTESAQEEGRQGDAMDLLQLYGDFFVGLKPLFLPMPIEIERLEMRSYVYDLLGQEHCRECVPVFNEHFTQLLAITGIQPVIGYTARDFLKHLGTNSASLAKIKKNQQDVPTAMRAWQRARAEGLDKDKELQVRINRRWFTSLVPERAHDERFIPIQERASLVEKLIRSPAKVYRACPAIRAESMLASIRSGFAKRDPTPQDAVDLMHAVPPLAYCSAFVTNDTHLHECLLQASRRLESSLIVTRTLADAINQLAR